MNARRCSRPSCQRPAVSTLTYVYSDSTAVLGPLALPAEPHSYDLCDGHSARLTAPRGWDVVRLDPDLRPWNLRSTRCRPLLSPDRPPVRPVNPPRPGGTRSDHRRRQRPPPGSASHRITLAVMSQTEPASRQTSCPLIKATTTCAAWWVNRSLLTSCRRLALRFVEALGSARGRVGGHRP